MKCVTSTGEVLPDQSVLAGYCEETRRFLIIQPEDFSGDREWKPTIRQLFSQAGASQTQWEDTILDSLHRGQHDGLWRLPTVKETFFLVSRKNDIGTNLANPEQHQKPVYWTARGFFSIGVGCHFETGKPDVFREKEVAAVRLVRSVSHDMLEKIRESVPVSSASHLPVAMPVPIHRAKVLA